MEMNNWKVWVGVLVAAVALTGYGVSSAMRTSGERPSKNTEPDVEETVRPSNNPQVIYALTKAEDIGQPNWANDDRQIQEVYAFDLVTKTAQKLFSWSAEGEYEDQQKVSLNEDKPGFLKIIGDNLTVSRSGNVGSDMVTKYWAVKSGNVQSPLGDTFRSMGYSIFSPNLKQMGHYPNQGGEDSTSAVFEIQNLETGSSKSYNISIPEGQKKNQGIMIPMSWDMQGNKIFFANQFQGDAPSGVEVYVLNLNDSSFLPEISLNRLDLLGGYVNETGQWAIGWDYTWEGLGWDAINPPSKVVLHDLKTHKPSTILSSATEVYLQNLISPDSKWLAYGLKPKDEEAPGTPLYLMDLAEKSSKSLGSDYGSLHSWSSDSKYLVYSLQRLMDESNMETSLKVYDLSADETIDVVTSGGFRTGLDIIGIVPRL